MQKCLRKMLLLSILLSFMLSVSAQLFDNFADGNFTENPTWIGDDTLFQINADLQLQLNATTAGSAALATANQRLTNTEWQFLIKVDFDPSSSSFARVYLATETENLHNPGNSYYLQFGEAGSNDAIELFYQQGSNTTSVCRSSDALIAKKFQARIKVVNNDGSWSIFADMTGGTDFALIATGNHNAPLNCQFFGVLTKYSNSYTKKIFFDDFYIGDEILDTEPPQLEQLTALPPSSLQLHFNEPIAQNSAENLANYRIEPENWQPITALTSNNNKTITLTFRQEWQPNHNYQIRCQNIADEAGNVASPITATFAWVLTLPNDVIINEIMADPSPTVALPEQEYIELYNRTNFAINLNNWMLTIGNTQKTFPDITIEPLNYLILCHNNAVEEMENYHTTCGFSSFSLANSGAQILLQDPQGNVISQVAYSDEWYNDPLKKEGGWSLELIDPENFCSTKTNWAASVDISGGTPGRLNSVDGENPDDELPQLLRAEYFKENVIYVRFSKTMQPETIQNPNHWSIDPPLTIAAIFPDAPDYQAAQIIFATPIEPNTIYALTVATDEMTDCGGNTIENGATVFFAIPEQPATNDVIINEIMHDGPQYVELYNRSEKIIDLKFLRFVFEKTTGNDSVHRALPAHLLFPDDYCVLTRKAEPIEYQYDAPYPETFVELDNFPALTVAEGIIRIAMADNPTHEIDAARYSQKMHAPLLNNTDGVSLERIHPDRPSNDPSNWHSAAENAGFGTPGYRNSQYDDGNGDDEISVDPQIFTPNNDGIDDYLNIRYRFDEHGYTMNVFIFDARGNRIRHLQNNVSVGTEGAFSWDGKTESGEPATAGIYIVYVEVFNLKGDVKRFKKTGTLGVKF